jgi:crossover junction endodeoxyribonuclease RuvC
MQKTIKKQRSTNNTQQIILGIDPGLADTGYGLIIKEGQKIKFLACGSIKTPAKTDFIKRLKTIHAELIKIIEKYRPDKAAVEQLFFCKNVKTALLVGQARGVCLMTIAEHNLPIFEYTPLQIKLALTSYGQADKRQVGAMVKLLLNLKTIPTPDDAADALAIAITTAHSTR